MAIDAEWFVSLRNWWKRDLSLRSYRLSIFEEHMEENDSADDVEKELW